MRRSLALLAVALTVLVAGCGGGSDSSSGGKTNIVLWHGYVDVEGKALTAAAKRFNATHPKIHVTVQNYGNADYALKKVLTAIRGGSYPDIVYLYGSWAANMARTPKAVDLAPLIKADPSINWNDFWPAERQAVTVGPKIVGVPALVDNLALVYNKKLFDQAGLAYPTADWTWDDFRAAAKQLTDPSAKQFGWAYVNDASEDTVWRFDALLWQAGGDILTPDQKHAAFNSPGRRRGRHPAPADGDRRPLGLPRQRQRQLRQPLQLGQDRHALHRAVGPLRVPGRRTTASRSSPATEPPDDLGPRPVGDARQRRRAPKRGVDVPQVVHVHGRGDAVVARDRRPADPGVADPDGDVPQVHGQVSRRRHVRSRTSRTQSRRGPCSRPTTRSPRRWGRRSRRSCSERRSLRQALDQAAQQVDQILAQG